MTRPAGATLAACLAVLTGCTAPPDGNATQPSRDLKAVHVSLEYAPRPRDLIHVELRFDAPCPATLVMPRAIPMGYGDVHYDRFVRSVAAFAADGTELTVVKAARGPRWALGRAGQRLSRVRYAVDVKAMERTVLSASDTSKTRPGYAGLLGYSVFAFLEEYEQHPIELEIRAPACWPVFTTLAPRSEPQKGRATARARDFYALADSQIAMGPELRVSRIDAAVPLFVALYSETEVDDVRIATLAREALDPLVAWFGSAPFDHYTVLQEYLKPLTPDHRYGFSMEHLDSGTFFLGTDRALTPTTPVSELARTRYNFAHHIAHSWIPKRCYGKGYYPFTWEVAPVLDSIWFSEGWGQYAAIAALAAVREDGEQYRKRFVRCRFRRSVELSPKFLNRMSLVEVSRIASTRYSDDFRTGLNVFARGGLMAAEIDDAIRAGTGGAKSLREFVRYLVALSAHTGKPLDLDQLPRMCSEATGVDVSGIYARWLGPVE